jgi:serine/threonine-protein kinase RsbW
MSQIIKFSSELRNLTLVERLVDKISEKYKINPDLYGNILISITEACNNAIVHGNRLNSEKSVEVKFEYENKLLIVNVSDEGEGFNFNNLPDPTNSENIEKLDGRGIFLIKNLADSVEFFNNGKQIKMTFNLYL